MTAAQVTVKPGETFRYYGETIYWNNFPEIQAYLNHLATGHSTTDWMTLLDRYPPAQRLLSLNCGDGWVERDLHKRGYARSVVGLDISEELLEQARRLAAQEGLVAVGLRTPIRPRSPRSTSTTCSITRRCIMWPTSIGWCVRC